MSENKKLKLLILDEWELEEQESWFNDMAKEGWLLDKLTFGFAVFVKDEPQDIQYRLEIASRSNQLEEGQIELYEEAGWEYVTSRRFIHVFRQKLVDQSIEIHTDPLYHAGTIKRLKQNILSRGILVIFITIFMLILQFSRFINPGSYDLLKGYTLSNLFFVFIYVYFALHMIRGMIHISRLIKKLNNNESFNHDKPYKRTLTVRKWSFCLYGLLLIALIFFQFINASASDVYPEIPGESLPVLTLFKLEDVNLKEVSYGTNGLERKWNNHFIEESSFFVPKQYRLQQEFIVPEKSGEEYHYEPFMMSDRFEARTNGIAEKLVEALKRERGMDDHVKVEHIRFDEVWLFEQPSYISLIARLDHIVFAVSYEGDQPSERIMDLIEDMH